MTHETVKLLISSLVLLSQFVIVIMALKILLRIPAQCKKEKLQFLLLFFSFIALITNSFSFYTLTYAFQKDIGNIATWQLLSFFALYLCWLGLTGIVLLTILVPNIFRLKELCKILIGFMPFNLLVILLFFLSKKTDASNSLGFLHSLNLTCAIELMLFDLILLCLICLENRGFQFLLSGIAIIISSTFLLDSSTHHPITTTSMSGELCWLLGAAFILIGLWDASKSTVNIFQFRKITSIKGNLVLWTFGISMISFLFFFLFAYIFSLINKLIFTELPFFIITYSLIVVLFSALISKYLEAPFKKIAANIEVFMLNKDKNQIQNQFSIEEFIFLQKFILNVFEVNEEKNRAQKELSELSIKITHDIRSPLSALDIVVNEIQRKIPEYERTMMRNAFRHIHNISNDLTVKYTENERNIDMIIFVYVVLKDIVSEKHLEYATKNIRFELILDKPGSAFVLTRGDYKEMRRMISNLINNAVNAMPTGGLINVCCSQENIDWVTIKIQDEGHGMTQTQIIDLLSETPTFYGTVGLGLKHAKEYIKQHLGKLEISSMPDVGTEIKLNVSSAQKPKWLCSELILDPEEEIVIVDDDLSIHEIWTKKFEQFEFKRQDYFSTAGMLENIAKLSKPILLLCDYEFSNESETGIDLLEKLNFSGLRKYLVTGNVDQKEVIKKCEALDLQLLPKHLLSYVPVSQKKLDKIDKENILTQEIDAILIDDNAFNHEFWRYAAGKKYILRCFFSMADFQKSAAQIIKHTPIYIDLNLKDENGLDVAKILYEQGFLKLYITTGYIDFDVADYPFLSGVTLKKPPFQR